MFGLLLDAEVRLTCASLNHASTSSLWIVALDRPQVK
jgi:hypothetical protein